MTKLNFDAESLGTVGNRVLDLSSQTTDVVNKIENEVNDLRPYWEGTTNEAIVAKMNEEITEIKKLLQNYETTGNNIVKMATDFGDNTEANKNAINAIKY